MSYLKYLNERNYEQKDLREGVEEAEAITTGEMPMRENINLIVEKYIDPKKASIELFDDKERKKVIMKSSKFLEKVDRHLEEYTNESVTAGVVGLVIGLLLSDATGLLTAHEYPTEDNILKAAKKAEWGGTKKVYDYIKQKIDDRKVRKQAKELAEDPDIKELIGNMKSSEMPFNRKSQNKLLSILKRKVDKDTKFNHIEKLLKNINDMI